MTEKQAKTAVISYVHGWKVANAKKIVKHLSENCVVIESHGPTYKGIDQIKTWVKEWHLDGGKVIKWDIDSFFFAKDGSVFFEWSFACMTEGKREDIEGASIILFDKDKIAHIHEYRMTEKAFDWTPHE